MRPPIRSQAFQNKSYLFMNLVRYFETISLTKASVDIAVDLLKTIPRSDILACSGLFSGTKLMDVYYAMPLDQRQ